MSAKILLSTERVWNKEGVAWSQKWLPYHLPEGYSGVTGVRRQRQNESNRTVGNSPRLWRQARAYINITHALELEHTTLSISRSTISLRDTFYLLEQIFIYNQISQISFFLYNARTFNYLFFLFTNFNYLHRNLTNTDAVLYRIVFQIESISNQNRIESISNRMESKGFCNFSIEN
jgi:hypothetical protein